MEVDSRHVDTVTLITKTSTIIIKTRQVMSTISNNQYQNIRPVVDCSAQVKLAHIDAQTDA